MHKLITWDGHSLYLNFWLFVAICVVIGLFVVADHYSD